MLLALPLKQMKHADVGGALQRVLDDRCRLDSRSVPPEASHAARELQTTRDQLLAIEKLTYSMSEAAAAAFVAYNGKLWRLERRFDAYGAEMGLQFTWKDSFKQKARATFGDLQWERVGVLFNAAAAYSYCACQAQPRGTAEQRTNCRTSLPPPLL